MEEHEAIIEYNKAILGMFEAPKIENKIKDILDRKLSDIESFSFIDTLDIDSAMTIFNNFLLFMTNYNYILYYKKFICNTEKSKESLNSDIIIAMYLFDIGDVQQEIIDAFLAYVDMDLREFIDLFDYINRLILHKEYQQVVYMLDKIIPMFRDLFGQGFQDLIFMQPIKIIREDFGLDDMQTKYLLDGMKQFDYPNIIKYFIELLEDLKTEVKVELKI